MQHTYLRNLEVYVNGICSGTVVNAWAVILIGRKHIPSHQLTVQLRIGLFMFIRYCFHSNTLFTGTLKADALHNLQLIINAGRGKKKTRCVYIMLSLPVQYLYKATLKLAVFRCRTWELTFCCFLPTWWPASCFSTSSFASLCKIKGNRGLATACVGNHKVCCKKTLRGGKKKKKENSCHSNEVL